MTRTVTVKHRSVRSGIPDANSYQPPTHGVRYFKVGDGFNLSDLQVELDGYMDILLGRLDPPNENGPMTLMEFSNAVYSRLREIEVAVLRGESDGTVTKGSRIYRFRTGELRSAIEMFDKAQDLGSRRVTLWRATIDD